VEINVELKMELKEELKEEISKIKEEFKEELKEELKKSRGINVEFKWISKWNQVDSTNQRGNQKTSNKLKQKRRTWDVWSKKCPKFWDESLIKQNQYKSRW
jgi:hypothetical protein